MTTAAEHRMSTEFGSPAVRRLSTRILIWPAALVMLYAAAILVFRVYIDPYSSWRHFSFGVVISTALTLISGVLALVILFGPWSARFFALGFVLGAALENRAVAYCASHDLLHATPGTWMPEGWYPLTVPVQRALLERGWGSIAAPPLSAHFVGMAMSGALCGVLTLVVSERVRRGRGASQPSTRAV